MIYILTRTKGAWTQEELKFVGLDIDLRGFSGFYHPPGTEVFVDGAIAFIHPETGLTQQEQALWISDYFIRYYATAVTNNEKSIIFTASDIIFNQIRIEVKNGKLKPEEIKFIHLIDEQVGVLPRAYHWIYVDHTGQLDKWPKGFFDTIEHQLIQLIS